MKNSKKRLMGMLISASVITTQLLIPSAAFAADTTATDSSRLAGANRDLTAVAISQSKWTSSDVVVLARDDDFADALSSGPLAGVYGAPVLLTPTKALPDDVTKEITRLGAKTVFIAGGTGAVSADVESALTAKSIKVTRISGKDRFATSKLIADAILAKTGKVTEVAIATGLNYPDALSIAPIATSKKAPIILTDGKKLSDDAAKFITDNKIATSYIVGGTGVVSGDIEKAVPGGVRLGGKDRYDTNALIIEYFKDSLDFSRVYVAVGDGLTSADGFPDALAGSALAGANNAPIALAYKSLSTTLTNLLTKYLKSNTQVIAFGGISAVPDSIITSVVATKNKDQKIPELSAISFKDQDNKDVPAVFDGNNIVITIPSTSTALYSGTVALNEDLASVTINSTALGIPVQKDVKTGDDFNKMLLDLAKAKNFNVNDGISVGGIKKYVSNATITLVDANGNKKVYTLIIK